MLRVHQMVVVPTLGKRPGLPRLQALIDAWFDYVESDTFKGGCFFINALFELDDIGDMPANEAVCTQVGAFLDMLEKYAKEAIAAGEFRRDLDVPQFAMALYGIDAGALIWRALGRAKSPFAIARKAARELLKQAMA